MDGGEMYAWWCVRVGKGTWGRGMLWLCSPKMVLICTQMAVWKPACRGERERERGGELLLGRKKTESENESFYALERERDIEGGPVKWRMIARHETSYSTQMSDPFTLTSSKSS